MRHHCGRDGQYRSGQCGTIVAVFMKLLERMDGRIVDFGSKLAAMFNDMQALHSEMTGVRQLPGTSSGDRAGRQLPPSNTTWSTNVQRDRSINREINNTVNVERSVVETVSDAATAPQTISDGSSTGMDWATMAASTPVPFTEVRSQRSIKRRRRQQSSQQPQQVRQSDVEQPARDRRRRGAQVLRGNATTNARGLAAAKHIVDKAVFCIDNVDPSCDVNDIKAFVSDLSVNVLSCFRVAPRRRRGEIGLTTDRRAFRLCIAVADQDRLLDDSKWPESVTISKWYYIDPSDGSRRRTAERRDYSASDATVRPASPSPVITPTASTSDAPAAAGATSSSSATQSSTSADDNVENMTDDNETTILYNDAASTAVV